MRSVHPRGQSHHCSARWSRTLCSQDALGPCSTSQVCSPFDHAARYLVVQGRRPTWPMALLIDTEARTVKSQLKSTALVIPVGVTWPQHFRRTPTTGHLQQPAPQDLHQKRQKREDKGHLGQQGCRAATLGLEGRTACSQAPTKPRFFFKGEATVVSERF